MREIVLDTETTGLDPNSGHRIVEIGCVEMIDYSITGNYLHEYLNPERDMPDEAFRVHGLSNDFLADKPLFAAVADKFLDFIGDATLVIHNAEFDMKFINAELAKLGRPPIPMDRTRDTVAMARRKFPGAQANLDALCNRFGIDNGARTKHGALLDSELLAEVYIELLGGKQIGLSLAGDDSDDAEAQLAKPAVERTFRPPRAHAASEAELAAHAELLTRIDNPIWTRD
ncbi:DNA polymerase III subunit epsilon [Hwanghaeella grinnelliae]|uniref:DNA polymerase III subunit epsilon n=1 Tax=Hwanghaeella grinnelliae TaxID=2500179 RepID=A0A437QNW4_9PROT|nr:DNA polymerase III subunit epsilon [Hwanghaeella grinnelliae]RVU36233.1 DNA polymerase III subunit epsilon [Hwanghaeella grinnelliae]